jgi:hypothetical protein
MRRATSRSTTDEKSDVAIHHGSAEASPAALWAVIVALCVFVRSGQASWMIGVRAIDPLALAALDLGVGASPPLSATLYLIYGVAGTNKTTITTRRGEPRRCGFWSAQRTHI